MADLIFASKARFLNRSTSITKDLQHLEYFCLWPSLSKFFRSFWRKTILSIETIDYHLFLWPGLTLLVIQRTQQRVPGKKFFSWCLRPRYENSTAVIEENISFFKNVLIFTKWKYSFQLVENYQKFQKIPEFLKKLKHVEWMIFHIKVETFMWKKGFFSEKAKTVNFIEKKLAWKFSKKCKIFIGHKTGFEKNWWVSCWDYSSVGKICFKQSSSESATRTLRDFRKFRKKTWTETKTSWGHVNVNAAHQFGSKASLHGGKVSPNNVGNLLSHNVTVLKK